VVAVATNPQGVTAAPVGTLAVRPCDGSVYVKRGGGATAFGWYLLASDQYINWQPRFVAATTQMPANASGQALSANPTTIINFLPQHSIAGPPFDPKRQYIGGYTSGVAGNSFLYRPLANVDNMPSQRIDGALLGSFLEFDFWWDVATTPRSSSVATSTDLTTNAMRIWAGGVFGLSTVQASGGSVSSDDLFDEWVTAFGAAGTDGTFGMAFRFSSAIDALQWQCVTANRAGGAFAQTVTPMGSIAPNTLYRLRMRCVFVSGVLTLFASINDGLEVAITGNVGPGATPDGLVRPFQPLASVRTINGTLKSLAVAQCAMNYGTGVGDC
jgi:hypothetical protein